MIAKNSQKPTGFVKDGTSMSGIAKDGNVIFSSKIKIVDFATGTDKEITAMLEAHYAGKINISDYWHVGDTRIMHLSAMPATPPYASESHASQDMTMVIIGIEHDDLKEKIGTRTKAAITLQCREVLGNTNIEDGSFEGTTQWSEKPRRTWLNTTFINALPNTIQLLLKTVIKKNLANHDDSQIGENTEDKVFFLSYTEIFGNTTYANYLKGGAPAEKEGKRYEYYKINAYRIKYGNNNGISNNNLRYHWLRSPSSFYYTCYITIDGDGNATYGGYDTLRGLAPAFCL